MRHSEPTYFHMPDKRERKQLFFFCKAPMFTSPKARGSSTCSVYSCRLSSWDWQEVFPHSNWQSCKVWKIQILWYFIAPFS